MHDNYQIVHDWSSIKNIYGNCFREMKLGNYLAPIIDDLSRKITHMYIRRMYIHSTALWVSKSDSDSFKLFRIEKKVRLPLNQKGPNPTTPTP